MACTIDIDTGGTFTDGFFTRNGRVEKAKVLTTPHDLTECFLGCIKAGAMKFGVPVEDFLYDAEVIRFSNTIGTNTIIQRSGSKLGLLLTSGKEDLAPVRSRKGEEPLVALDMVLGVREAVTAGGEVVTAVDGAEVLKAAQELIDRGARCLVVAFANSDSNPANERAARDIIKREFPRDYLGSVPVVLASNISPRSGEVERINAAVVNAYIHAKLVRLLYKAGEILRGRMFRKTLLIGHNNGTVARVAKTRAINTYNSGPAGGLLGAESIGSLYGVRDLLTADMGGTSFDVGYIRAGVPSYTLAPVIEGFPVNVPMLAIRAIGAGGGSIAHVSNGRLAVGPQSAGALPGPAAFDLGGTEPTVTDADVVLGIIDADYFLGGAMRLSREKAAEAIKEKIARPLGLSVAEAAFRIKQAVDEHMGLELRAMRQEAGFASEPLLVVYGGAGPTHCCDYARIAGVKKIIVTPFSSVFSAFGSSTQDVGHIYYRRVDAPLEVGGDMHAVSNVVASMNLEALRDLRGEGFTGNEVTTSLELFVRAEGGAAEERIPAEPGFCETPSGQEATLRRARTALGTNGDGNSGRVVLSAVGLRAQAPVPHHPVARLSRTSSSVTEAVRGRRPTLLGEGGVRVETFVYDMARLAPGHTLSGPAIVESESTTVLIQPDWTLSVDEYGNCVIEEANKA
ncbi:MAG: hydantoinase/oxoprolinase family protein [Desulfobacteria bacterium]